MNPKNQDYKTYNEIQEIQEIIVQDNIAQRSLENISCNRPKNSVKNTMLVTIDL